MRRLPFKPQRLGRHRVEHHLPRVRVKTDIARGVPPVAVHGAVFDGDFHAVVFGAARQFGENLLEARHRGGHVLALERAGKGRNRLRAEKVRVIDGVFQIAPLRFVFQRVAVIAQRGHGFAGSSQNILHLRRKLADIDSAVGHMKIDREAFEIVILHRRQPFFRQLSRNTGSDFDLFHAVPPMRGVFSRPRRMYMLFYP